MGSIKIASRGGQNHALAREELHSRFKEYFGMNLEG